ncbi:uncharacterized protein LOC129535523 isoform X11 [Moschus berezovskii]|uniref:uncharacterized protein LOC129535523 isoform X11 n=1 Tax=Moschus berezovskii TaxID=68408 RepID=UPI002444AEA8|nr:uncharacterized protein LOC129535523 isoform X11 [Moschus berezovskii]
MSGCSSDPATLGASKPATEEAKSSSEERRGKKESHFFIIISESVLLRDDQKFDTCELQEGLPAQPMMGIIIESTMTQESPKNSAAEIPVTSNGEVDDSHEHGFNRDLKRSLPAGLGLSETQITTHGFDSTKEGVIEAGAFQDSWSLLRLRSIESVMPSNHLILCCPLLLLPSVFPSISLPVLYPWDSSDKTTESRRLDLQLKKTKAWRSQETCPEPLGFLSDEAWACSDLANTHFSGRFPEQPPPPPNVHLLPRRRWKCICPSLTGLLGQGARPGPEPVCPPRRGPAPTKEAVFFSFLWRAHSPLETSSRVVVPSWEPQTMKHPLSCTRR